MYLWAKDRLPQTKHPIYAYLWTHIEPGPDSARYLAFHSSEIPYVFDTVAAKYGKLSVLRETLDNLGRSLGLVERQNVRRQAPPQPSLQEST